MMQYRLFLSHHHFVVVLLSNLVCLNPVWATIFCPMTSLNIKTSATMKYSHYKTRS